MNKVRNHFIGNLQKYKYEILLFALLQHLFIGIFLVDFNFYTRVIWPINMVLLGWASVGVFMEKSKIKNLIRQFLFFVVFMLPLGMPFFSHFEVFMVGLNVSYVLFFSFIFYEVILFLLKPSYINIDIITASACGYFLLLEIMVFSTQFLFYQYPNCIKGVDISNPAATFIDLVYFCGITLTSIGFGDITPNSAQTKLITTLFGTIGQFYSVILVGILISKFTSRTQK